MNIRNLIDSIHFDEYFLYYDFFVRDDLTSYKKYNKNGYDIKKSIDYCIYNKSDKILKYIIDCTCSVKIILYIIKYADYNICKYSINKLKKDIKYNKKYTNYIINNILNKREFNFRKLKRLLD